MTMFHVKHARWPRPPLPRGHIPVPVPVPVLVLVLVLMLVLVLVQSVSRIARWLHDQPFAPA